MQARRGDADAAAPTRKREEAHDGKTAGKTVTVEQTGSPIRREATSARR